jgi:hypothetical protein
MTANANAYVTHNELKFVFCKNSYFLANLRWYFGSSSGITSNQPEIWVHYSVEVKGWSKAVAPAAPDLKLAVGTPPMRRVSNERIMQCISPRVQRHWSRRPQPEASLEMGNSPTHPSLSPNPATPLLSLLPCPAAPSPPLVGKHPSIIHPPPLIHPSTHPTPPHRGPARPCRQTN